MSDPESWRWVWLILTGAFLVGELLTPGSFILLPFAAGGLAATIAAFADASLGVQWALFVAVAGVFSVAFIPLRRRLDRQPAAEGVGSLRLVNQEAVVLDPIEPGPNGRGLVRIGREEWGAISADGSAVDVGVLVRIIDVRGTGVVVTPIVPPVT